MSITTSLADLIYNLFKQAGIDVGHMLGEISAAIILIIVSIFIGWLTYFFFERYLSRWAKKTKTTLDDEILKNIKKPIYLFVILVGSYYALDTISLLKLYASLIADIFIVAEILLVTFVITRIINVLLTWYAKKSAKKGKKMSEHILFIFKKTLHFTVYLFALLAILAAFRIDLTNVVIGMGVGGIAIALALQNILSDMFSAFSIYFDKPFEIGDFIIVDNYAGIVKRIGLKSTRLELLQGEELIMSNRELTNTSIRNFKKMKKRRIVFTIGVTYDTPLEKLKEIPDIIRNVIQNIEMAEMDRVHFKEYGPYSLNFEIVYYMKTRDYMRYMDTQQEINFAIKKEFEKREIEMAFPTQTIIINKEN